MSEKTIAAISTPCGQGGIGVIRISGDRAIETADKCFVSFCGKRLADLDGYSALYGKIEHNGQTLDEAVALVFKAPKSYTGEDVVELSVHGGSVVTASVLRAVLDCGAVAAEGGEFTKRAFLNGKLDLAKAESVMSLISAKSEAAMKISRQAKSGRVSAETERITSKLLETAASLAAYSDYPDEEIEGLDFDNFLSLLTECEQSLERLIENYDIGRVLQDGVDCSIVGKPNVGKSTLMNLLCGCDRSIVTDIAGTTRDIVESTVNLGGIILNLADTAGIHNSCDEVESIGVEKARDRLDGASIVLAVFDMSRPLDNNDFDIISKLSDNAVAVLNKCDLEIMADEKVFSNLNTVKISAKNASGIGKLETIIKQITGVLSLDEKDAVLISERQRSCAKKALDGVVEAKNTLKQGFTLDAVGVCVDDAVAALLELTGKRVTNEVCDEVFRRFCVGK